MKLNQVKFTGSYTCRHFKLSKQKVKSGCCGAGEDYVCVCILDNQLCPGIVQCLKLGNVEKSNLVKKWREDLQSNKEVDVKEFIE